MKERPILFSAPMVRAILEGRKTQTRRLIKGQPLWRHLHVAPVPERGPFYLDEFGNLLCKYISASEGMWSDGTNRAGVITNAGRRLRCLYGVPGDRLWVRETWARYEPYPSGEHVHNGLLALPQVDVRKDETLWEYWSERIVYRANYDCPTPGELPDKGQYDERWRPSIFMPRWASRITLEITNVRLQRLQEISEEDAIAEGSQIPLVQLPPSARQAAFSERQAYSRIWESINGAGSWNANPWVWALTFRRLRE